jgi:predicted HicB family RNase H-like nuclease
MPKKKTSKVAKGAATKKAKAPVKRSVAPVKKKTAAAKAGPKPVAAKGAVGFRLRMDPNTHKQLQKISHQKGISQNTLLNQLIKDAK